MENEKLRAIEEESMKRQRETTSNKKTGENPLERRAKKKRKGKRIETREKVAYSEQESKYTVIVAPHGEQ